MEGLQIAKARMSRAGVPQQAIDVFENFYHQLEHGATGLIPESDILPLDNVDRVADLSFDRATMQDAARRTVVIKLNGGLGASMGMECAKSLLEVAEGETFLDIIVEQMRHLRADLGVNTPLMFMNSFRTQDDTLAALAKYEDLPIEGIPL
ncbi:MAG: UTP--glucose-1-phosphate uridylyltransferase, partial [Aeromicrobium sp.]